MYNDVRLKMSPPWITYVNELTALFKNDQAIEIRYDNDIPAVYITVNDAPDKAAAFSPKKHILGMLPLIFSSKVR